MNVAVTIRGACYKTFVVVMENKLVFFTCEYF
jgi:hypothetical protein